MTTTTGTAGSLAAERPGAHSTSTRLRITARGRRVLAAVVALPVAAIVCTAIIGGGVAVASRDAGAPAGSFMTVTVGAGQSLWSIAQRVAPGADPRDVVDAIVQLNALDGVMVMPGERLAIPAQYSRK